MATKELVKAEIDTLPDSDIDELYNLVKDFKASKQQIKKGKSFLEVARSLQMDGPPDFSTRYHEYLYGETAKRSGEGE
jgi:hypothetical protein